MSTLMNKGAKMHSKSVTYNFFTLVGLLAEPITSIEKKVLS